MPKVYLDNCCLNRPFDNQSQERVRLEAEAVLTVLRYFTEGQWEWVGSDGMISAARRSAGLIHVRVQTPIAWLAEVLGT